MNIDEIRKDFPITEECVYLDNAGLSPFPTSVIQAVNRVLDERSRKGANAYWEWLDTTEEVKQLLAGLIHAVPEEIAITQNTAEGINIVANMLDWEPKDNVVVNDLEFPANYWPWLRLRKFGVEIRVVHHKNGLIRTEDIAAKTDDKTKVITLSSISFVNGLKHDLAEIGTLAKQHNAYFVVDAIQSVGATELDVRQGQVDFLSCGGHKWLFSLLGSGFFYCRRELIERFEPAYIGRQSDGRKSTREFIEYDLAPTAHRFMHGNSNMAGVFAFHAGIQYINHLGLKNIETRNRQLTDFLIGQLKEREVGFLSPLEDKYRSAIVNFVPPDPQRIVDEAKKRRIAVVRRGAGIRVSPNFYNTEEEISEFINVVDDCTIGA